MNFLEQKLAAGDFIILDGGTGTELERCDAEMHDASWCAMATKTHPDVLRSVHDSFIEAGADIITANTYASTLATLEAAGAADEFESLNRAAVRIAREAVDAADRPVAVAGSMSVSRPIEPGTDRIIVEIDMSESAAREKFRAKAELLADTGVDLIVMEMMRDLDLSKWATEEAVKTGLPVWVGMSCERDSEGRLVGFGRHEYAFEDIIDGLVSLGGTVAAIMHSSLDDTDAALPLLRDRWDGPIAIYPESGYFEMPHWQFVDVVEPQIFAKRARTWIDAGVQIIGGCCGMGPEHIEALAGLRQSIQSDKSRQEAHP